MRLISHTLRSARCTVWRPSFAWKTAGAYSKSPLASQSFVLHEQAVPSASPVKLAMASFHFGSREYASCFALVEKPDPAPIRASALKYLESFNPKLWYDEPMVTLFQGKKLVPEKATPVDTIDALGQVNGKQIMATPDQVALLKKHIQTYKSPHTDLREKMRAVEQQFLDIDGYAGFLIGNQCVDFQKQDGVTEIEESIMANTVERRLNDLLLRDEQAGKVAVSRKPIYVSCVSNFSNFLDLFRKTIRSLEVGVPCIILSRSNTSQHCFRWAEVLNDLMLKQGGIDPGMVTFLSCSLEDIIDITTSCKDQTGMLYTTSSRDLAKAIKSGYPNTIASTGGPNTLVLTSDCEWTPAIKQAIQMSASIESSGQCTALRHCVVPSKIDQAKLESVFDEVKEIPTAPEALKGAVFDGVFKQHKGSRPPAENAPYGHHKHKDAYFKIGDDFPEKDINEYWRKVVVDFSRMDLSYSNTKVDTKPMDRLAAWLNENQPITLAINGPREESFKLGLYLWERTGMVVNTVGSCDNPKMPPALTCQARPQDAECFGEFPPRRTLNTYTKYPVIVPSSNPSYDTYYTETFLKFHAANVSAGFSRSTKAILNAVQDECVRGYAVLLIEYLQNVCIQNPKLGFGSNRTALWGLQRPPIGTKTYMVCGADTVWDQIAPMYVIFNSTTAKPQCELSIDPGNAHLLALCEEHKLAYTKETRAAMEQRLQGKDAEIFDILDAPAKMTAFPMVGQFVSLYLPLGHVKSTMADDMEFAFRFKSSEKWLNSLF